MKEITEASALVGLLIATAVLLAHSWSFLANQKARNAIVGAENLRKADKPRGMLVEHSKNS